MEKDSQFVVLYRAAKRGLRMHSRCARQTICFMAGGWSVGRSKDWVIQQDG